MRCIGMSRATSCPWQHSSSMTGSGLPGSAGTLGLLPGSWRRPGLRGSGSTCPPVSGAARFLRAGLAVTLAERSRLRLPGAYGLFLPSH